MESGIRRVSKKQPMVLGPSAVFISKGVPVKKTILLMAVLTLFAGCGGGGEKDKNKDKDVPKAAADK